MSIERRSQVVQRDEALLPVEDNESWALSYIDLLLLMATLFVLLLSYQQEKIQQASEKAPLFLQIYQSNISDVLYQRKFGNQKIELSVKDKIKGTQAK